MGSNQSSTDKPKSRRAAPAGQPNKNQSSLVRTPVGRGQRRVNVNHPQQPVAYPPRPIPLYYVYIGPSNPTFPQYYGNYPVPLQVLPQNGYPNFQPQIPVSYSALQLPASSIPMYGQYAMEVPPQLWGGYAPMFPSVEEFHQNRQLQPLMRNQQPVQDVVVEIPPTEYLVTSPAALPNNTLVDSPLIQPEIELASSLDETENDAAIAFYYEMDDSEFDFGNEYNDSEFDFANEYNDSEDLTKINFPQPDINIILQRIRENTKSEEDTEIATAIPLIVALASEDEVEEFNSLVEAAISTRSILMNIHNWEEDYQKRNTYPEMEIEEVTDEIDDGINYMEDFLYIDV